VYVLFLLPLLRIWGQGWKPDGDVYVWLIMCTNWVM